MPISSATEQSKFAPRELPRAFNEVKPWHVLDDAQRDEGIARVRALPVVSERVMAMSAGFLSTPYAHSPLGEGQGRDSDPLIRFDAVDCLTFVEEVMAMSLAPNAERRLDWLNRIRYAGAAQTWESRNHIVEAQWLPRNVEAGLLRDVTKLYGGEQTRVVKKVLSDATWQAKSAVELGLARDARPTGTFELNIVPVAEALKKLSRAPSGLMVVVVRGGRRQSVTDVSHVGLLIQTPQGPVLRHASRTYKQVVDEPLAKYLTRNLNHSPSTIEGLALYEIGEPQKP